jgi:hypothetical protein
MPLFVPLGILLIIFVGIAILLAALLAARSARRRLQKVFQEAALPRSVAKALRESRYFGKMVLDTVAQYPPGPLRDRLALTARSVSQWLTSLDRLERGLARLYSQRNLTRDLRQAAIEIEALRRRLLLAQGHELAGLRDLLQSKEQHLATLRELNEFQTQAELKIQKIASDLGATHAEMLLIVAKGNFNERRLHRLDESLQEQLSGMRDIMAAMDDIGYSRAGS